MKSNGKIYHLNKWAVVHDGDPYRAPEARRISLTGFRDNEEQQIITSEIVEIDGKYIRTWSGSIYILGEINEEYLAWMKKNNIKYDPENPISLKDKEDSDV